MNRAQWNKLASRFESQVCDITREGVTDQITRYVNAVPLPRTGSVLVDLGCGLGSFVGKFGNRFSRVIATDHAGKIIERARKLCVCKSPVTWLVTDLASVPDAIGCCSDLTVCMNVITSSNAKLRQAQWSSLARVTKPRGYALVVLPSVESDKLVREMGFRAGRAAEFKSTDDGLVERDKVFQKAYARAELASTFEAHGFAVKRIGRANYPWSVEGLRKPSTAKARLPWDWICLARRAP
jgi:SAM-dependent methyltransferase